MCTNVLLSTICVIFHMLAPFTNIVSESQGFQSCLFSSQLRIISSQGHLGNYCSLVTILNQAQP